MSYIKQYGIALPQFRIEDNILHLKGKKGVMKSVCFPDEDIITLAYQATCGIAKENIDGIFFATSTPVFKKRYHASYLGDLLNLKQGILALDFVNTTRCGTDALLLANNLVDSGKYKNIVVVASDVSFPEIGKELSAPFGHAACAVLVSNETGYIEIVAAQSVSSSFAEELEYKGNNIQYDPRFSRDAGFKENQFSALKKLVSEPKSFDAIVLNSLYARMAGGIYTKAEFDEKQFARDVLTSKIGNTGAAHAILLLINELEQGKKNILFVDYANGTNLFEIKNNNSNNNIEHKLLQTQLINYELVGSYQDYLLLSKAVNFNASGYETKDMFSSEMMQEREKETLLYLKGRKCDSCGTIYYIKSAQCKKCKTSKFSEIQLQTTGTVYALTNEHYFPASFPPITMVVVDLDGGGRMTVQQTNTMYPEKNKMGIGVRVKLVLRKMMENDCKPNYFWKAIQI